MQLVGQNFTAVAKSSNDSDFSLKVNSGSLELTLWDGQTMKYGPMQMHFHMPSEHTIDGKRYDMEMHLVH